MSILRYSLPITIMTFSFVFGSSTQSFAADNSPNEMSSSSKVVVANYSPEEDLSACSRENFKPFEDFCLSRNDPTTTNLYEQFTLSESTESEILFKLCEVSKESSFQFTYAAHALKKRFPNEPQCEEDNSAFAMILDLE